jgi:Clp amino terminal domain, pathogenicity island component
MGPSPSVQDLIGSVLSDAPDDAPLTRLTTAAVMVRDVGDAADAALGYFVDQARRAGHSWSEIGDALGVSKQAAQQRHGPRVAGVPVTFERFTERARHVIASTETTARDLGHPFIGTEHLLLALYSEPEGLGCRVLVESGLSAEAVRAAIVDELGPGPGGGEGRLPYTPRAVKALTSALAAAVELGHNYIGTEHLLLGVGRVDGGLAAKILHAAGLDEGVLQPKVTALLAGFHKSTSGTAASTAPSTKAAAGPRSTKATASDPRKPAPSKAAGTGQSRGRAAKKPPRSA